MQDFVYEVETMQYHLNMEIEQLSTILLDFLNEHILEVFDRARETVMARPHTVNVSG